VLHCLRLELDIFYLSHLLLLGLQLFVKAVESLVNRGVAALLSEPGLHYHARGLIDLRVPVILLRGVLALLLELFVDAPHEVILVLQELIEIALLVTLLDGVNDWLEGAALDVLVLHLGLQLLNLCFLAHVEFVDSSSELLLI